MVSRAPGAPQTPEIEDFRPAQNSCIKNPGVSQVSLGRATAEGDLGLWGCTLVQIEMGIAGRRFQGAFWGWVPCGPHEFESWTFSSRSRKGATFKLWLNIGAGRDGNRRTPIPRCFLGWVRGRGTGRLNGGSTGAQLGLNRASIGPYENLMKTLSKHYQNHIRTLLKLTS